MTISIAMCTYNGAKYIHNQLTSIFNQTMEVNEIVICDDGSTDETLKIIERIKRETSIAIKIMRNKKNLGFYRNFLQAMSLCTGDLVFLSDQDDVWREDKVEKIVAYIEQNEGIDVVFTDAQLIDENGNVFTSETLWDRVGFSSKMQWYFKKGYGQEIWTIINRATGATMAARRAFIDSYNWEEFNLPVHDYIISLIAVIEKKCGFIVEPLTKYRIHAVQTIGASYYEPDHYSPLRAYTIELDKVQNLPEKAYERLKFMRLRERLYGCKFGGLMAVGRVRDYIRHYGAWWYRFMGYDIIVCMKKDACSAGKLLLRPFKWLRRK